MYKNEREIGNTIRSCSIPRENIFLTTKIYHPNNSYNGTQKAIENSLKELQVEYVDMILIHEPYKESQEMYKAMEKAYREGKTKAIGVSNFNEEFFEEFIKGCEITPAINQVEAHVFFNQKELQNKVEKYGTYMQAWSPFASGKRDIFSNKVLISIGSKYGKTAAQIALKYLVQRGVAVIPKSAKKNRLLDNIDIFNFELYSEDIKLIEKFNQGKTLFGWY